jgi:serine phosphatase RsbU (regulator of sigma subunit)
MQRYLLDLEQIALLRDLNQVVRAELGGGHYATMVAVGFRGRRGLAVMTNAGHPPSSLASCLARRMELARN